MPTRLRIANMHLAAGSIAAALTPQHLNLIPLAGGAHVSTSVIWKSANETPAPRTVIAVAQKHLVDGNKGKPPPNP